MASARGRTFTEARAMVTELWGMVDVLLQDVVEEADQALLLAMNDSIHSMQIELAVPGGNELAQNNIEALLRIKETFSTAIRELGDEYGQIHAINSPRVMDDSVEGTPIMYIYDEMMNMITGEVQRPHAHEHIDGELFLHGEGGGPGQLGTKTMDAEASEDFGGLESILSLFDPSYIDSLRNSISSSKGGSAEVEYDAWHRLEFHIFQMILVVMHYGHVFKGHRARLNNHAGDSETLSLGVKQVLNTLQKNDGENKFTSKGRHYTLISDISDAFLKTSDGLIASALRNGVTGHKMHKKTREINQIRQGQTLHNEQGAAYGTGQQHPQVFPSSDGEGVFNPFSSKFGVKPKNVDASDHERMRSLITGTTRGGVDYSKVLVLGQGTSQSGTINTQHESYTIRVGDKTGILSPEALKPDFKMPYHTYGPSAKMQVKVTRRFDQGVHFSARRSEIGITAANFNAAYKKQVEGEVVEFELSSGHVGKLEEAVGFVLTGSIKLNINGIELKHVCVFVPNTVARAGLLGTVEEPIEGEISFNVTLIEKGLLSYDTNYTGRGGEVKYKGIVLTEITENMNDTEMWTGMLKGADVHKSINYDQLVREVKELSKTAFSYGALTSFSANRSGVDMDEVQNMNTFQKTIIFNEFTRMCFSIYDMITSELAIYGGESPEAVNEKEFKKRFKRYFEDCMGTFNVGRRKYIPNKFHMNFRGAKRNRPTWYTVLDMGCRIYFNAVGMVENDQIVGTDRLLARLTFSDVTRRNIELPYALSPEGLSVHMATSGMERILASVGGSQKERSQLASLIKNADKVYQKDPVGFIRSRPIIVTEESAFHLFDPTSIVLPDKTEINLDLMIAEMYTLRNNPENKKKLRHGGVIILWTSIFSIIMGFTREGSEYNAIAVIIDGSRASRIVPPEKGYPLEGEAFTTNDARRTNMQHHG